jgi:hypothetical protein
LARVWAIRPTRKTKLDDHLAEIEAPGDPAKVRAEAGETVRKLIAALRDRATRPA